MPSAARFKFVTVMHPPPGPSIRRPTAADPRPSTNPPVFTDAMTVRNTVFVDEQACAADMELDDDDARSWHWVMYDTTPSNTTTTYSEAEKEKKPIGVIRLVPPPHAPHEHLHPTIADGVDTTATRERHDGPFVKITRVALLQEYRGRGLSRDLVDVALQWAARHPAQIEAASSSASSSEPITARWDGLVLVHAQTTIEGLYGRMGFETDRGLGTWTEERIEHVGMWRSIEVSRDRE